MHRLTVARAYRLQPNENHRIGQLFQISHHLAASSELVIYRLIRFCPTPAAPPSPSHPILLPIHSVRPPLSVTRDSISSPKIKPKSNQLVVMINNNSATTSTEAAMDLAASSSTAPAVEPHPAVEKAREKQRKKIVESITGLKAGDQVDFLISRLAESELSNMEQKKETDLVKRESGKLNAKLDSAQKMLSKMEVAKSKLEQLCRELNKAQREEKEHNQLRLKQMQTTHTDTVESFKKSLAEIQQSVEAKQEHSKRVADVERLSNNLNQMAADYETRLNELRKLYEERESDLNKMASTKDKELTTVRAQIEEMQKRVTDVFTENVALKKELLATEGRLKQSIETELSLRKVLDEYSGKYATLTQSFASSSTQFDKAKEQLGRMNGNLIKVQADARKWKDKADEASKMITELSQEKANADKLVALKDRQLFQLQELCRRLNKMQQPGFPEDSFIEETAAVAAAQKSAEAEENGTTMMTTTVGSSGEEADESTMDGDLDEKLATQTGEQLDMEEEGNAHGQQDAQNINSSSNIASVAGESQKAQ